MKGLKELELENAKLFRKAISHLTLYKLIHKEAARGNHCAAPGVHSAPPASDVDLGALRLSGAWPAPVDTAKGLGRWFGKTEHGS